MSNIARHHVEWLSLVETSGPFLSLPVLQRVFPQGLDARDTGRAALLREAYDDWQDRGIQHAAVHRVWVRFVLTNLLDFGEFLVEGQSIPPGLETRFPIHNETLRPDFVLRHRDATAKPCLLIQVYPPEQNLDKPVSGSRWNASPGTRMMELLHAVDLPLGLVTNGEQWMLVYAPRGETTGFASWYADLWMQESLTLRAFHSLLGLRRFVGVAEGDTLAAMLAESSKDQQEVTAKLGKQVHQAVEVLVQALDRVDAESQRALLADVAEKDVYNAALTMMMRLVFLFSAEERELLPLNDAFYSENYAASTISAQLRERADQFGEEVLERRYDAWGRLLATFRAVHGGVRHDRLQLPAYGGSLFNPDRYCFLEGRAAGTCWRQTSAKPLPINNRVVLHLLEALQYLRVKIPGGGPAERRRLSFRALDIEQIGHVYEGLLDHTARRANGVVLGLGGKHEPEISLAALESKTAEGREKLAEYLAEETGKSLKAVGKALDKIDADEFALQHACAHEMALVERVRPFGELLREDSFGRRMVIHPGSLYVTRGSDRRSTGTHYTPRSLTEPVVQHTLEPLVYVGPAEGLPQEQWTLKSPKELLALKICDLAMGSGAFLVQACRYMSERLVEAWELAERNNPGQVLVTPDGDLSSASPAERLLPLDAAERLALARRYVADRCLYGVDINPMAVEMAKLSLWLITVQRDRPFTFLDHALKCGDSLLGVSNVSQIENFSLRPGEQQITFGTANLFRYVEDASAKRRALESLPSNDNTQIETKQRLHAEAEAATAKVKAVADCLIALELRGLGDEIYADQRVVVAAQVQQLLQNDSDAKIDTSDHRSELARVAHDRLHGRRPFHWAIEFPEIFALGGFDALVGNPPFMGGTLATECFGADYTSLLQRFMPPWHGKADYVVGFFKRIPLLIQRAGKVSLVATSSLLRGETLESGLRDLRSQQWQIYNARSPYKWPGSATLEVVNVSLSQNWNGALTLDGQIVHGITEEFSAGNPDDLIPQELPNRHLEGALGIKLCPANRELPFGQYQIESVDAPEYQKIYVPALGGDEIYDLVDFDRAPRAIHPEKLSAFLKGGEFMSSKSRISALRPSDYAHSAPASGLMARLRLVRFAFACGETSTALRFCRVPIDNCILKHKLVVFPANSWSVFSILQSDIHVQWAWRWGLRRESRIVYSPKRCALTFPLPQNMLNQYDESGLVDIAIQGQKYHEFRAHVSQLRQEGLTKIYNRIHDRNEKSEDIIRLRMLHTELNRVVSNTYGWSDLDFGYDFHPTKQGERYTISEAARRIVLDRLLALNHQRYAEEVAAGLHDKKGKKTTAADGNKRKGRNPKASATVDTVRQLPAEFRLSATEPLLYTINLVVSLLSEAGGSLSWARLLDAFVLATQSDLLVRFADADNKSLALEWAARWNEAATPAMLIPSLRQLAAALAVEQTDEGLVFALQDGPRNHATEDVGFDAWIALRIAQTLGGSVTLPVPQRTEWTAQAEAFAGSL